MPRRLPRISRLQIENWKLMIFPLVPMLRVGTHDPRCSASPGPTRSVGIAGSHAERGNQNSIAIE